MEILIINLLLTVVILNLISWKKMIESIIIIILAIIIWYIIGVFNKW